MGNVVGSMAASLPGGEIQGGSFSDAIGKLANRAAKSNGKLTARSLSLNLQP
jgi:hypothetical protein